MEYKHLGRSGLKVSRLALGTMNFGWVTDKAGGFSIMDEALEQGINLFDTADVYGGPQSPDMEQGYGTSEEIIGRWLAQGGRRDRIVLATKPYQPMGHRPQFEAYEAICDQLGEQPADVALAWLLHQPVVTAPIIGPRTLDQLTASQRALKVDLSADALRRLDKIWPGPGGEAPQAYAWCPRQGATTGP
jgi:aryl-alcohol dehydrogenase-like predicted oxidoreductase